MLKKKAKKCIEKAIRALEINFGAVNADMIISDDGKVHIVDIGARMGGNMIGPCIIPYGTGIDYMGAILQTALEEKVDLTVHPHGAVATKLLAFHDGTINRLPDFEKFQKEYEVEVYHHMKLGDVVNEYHTNLDGCGYIVAKSDSLDKALACVEKAFGETQRSIFGEDSI